MMALGGSLHPSADVQSLFVRRAAEHRQRGGGCWASFRSKSGSRATRRDTEAHVDRASRSTSVGGRSSRTASATLPSGGSADAARVVKAELAAYRRQSGGADARAASRLAVLAAALTGGRLTVALRAVSGRGASLGSNRFGHRGLSSQDASLTRVVRQAKGETSPNDQIPSRESYACVALAEVSFILRDPNAVLMLPIELDANVAPFAFAAAGGPFEVVRFTAREAVSDLYAVELELASDDPDIDFAAMLGQPATLTRFRGLDPVAIHGVVTSMDLGARSSDRTVYRVRLEPALSRLGLAVQSRVFQDATVVDVAKDLLDEHGLAGAAVRFDIERSYPQREYTVQYEETDLNFFRRLLEREGIWFQFEHPEDGARETLVVTDRRSAFTPVGPGPSGAPAIVYREGSGFVRDRAESVTALRLHEHVVPGTVVLKDYNYRTPDLELLAEAPVEGGGDQEVYLFGEHFKDLSEGQRLAQTRADEIACQRRIVRGDSDAAGFTPGVTFTLEGHYRADLNAEYVVTSVQHEGEVSPDDVGGDGAPQPPRYANTFEAIPAKAPFRPARTTRIPKAPGLMTGRVESGGGEYAFIDEDGRYRARLGLDRSDKPESQASKPVRMAQPYSGSGYGLHFPNHAGTEVVLGFANGDVDRPMALGTVPNPSQSSPSTAANSSQNVIKTMGGNGLTMDDMRGDEHVTLKSTKDHTEEVANNQNVNVGASQAMSVGGSRSKSVSGNQSESVGGDKNIQVTGSHSESITGSGSVSITGDESRQTGGNQTVDVTGSATHTVTGALSVTVEGAVSETFAAGQTTSVKGAVTIEATEKVTIQVGSSSITLTPDAITLSATSVVVTGGTAVDVGASASIKINAPEVDIN